MAPVSGKPVTYYCADTDDAWTQYVQSLGSRVYELGYVPAIGGSEVYLSSYVCDPLKAKLAGTSLSVMNMLPSMFVLTHETEHTKGVRDERLADCAAIRDIPKTARAFGFTTTKKIKQIVALARAYHAASPRPYNGACT